MAAIKITTIIAVKARNFLDRLFKRFTSFSTVGRLLGGTMNYLPYPTIAITIFIAVFLAVHYHRSNAKQDKAYEDFWDKEHKANLAKPVDLTSLSYITIPLAEFPLHFSDDPEVTEIEDALEELSRKRILNLSGVTNTDLKLTYGAANLASMQDIADNFESLTMLLVDYAKALMEHKNYAGAVKVLSFGVEIESDMSSNYTLLGDCYKELGDDSAIKELIETLESREFFSKKTAMDYLLSLDSQIS